MLQKSKVPLVSQFNCILLFYFLFLFYIFTVCSILARINLWLWSLEVEKTCFTIILYPIEMKIKTHNKYIIWQTFDLFLYWSELFISNILWIRITYIYINYSNNIYLDIWLVSLPWITLAHLLNILKCPLYRYKLLILISIHLYNCVYKWLGALTPSLCLWAPVGGQLHPDKGQARIRLFHYSKWNISKDERST